MYNLTDNKKKLLNQMGLKTFNDVIYYLPKRYEDTSLDSYLSSYHDKHNITIEASVIKLATITKIRNKLTKVVFSVLFNGEVYQVIAFNRNYLSSSLKLNQTIIIKGKYNHRKKEIVLSNIIYDLEKKDSLIPIYNLVDGLSNNEFSKIVAYSFSIAKENNLIKEIIPSYLKEKYRLVSRLKAYYLKHFPTSMEDLKEAERYFKYEELLIYSLTLLYNKQRIQESEKGLGKKVNRELVNKFINSLPYKLTYDQEDVIEEIIKDEEKSSNMYRLLQGDVGTGKTIVSTIALIACCSANFQGALMAPTDILARQHYKVISSLLENSDYKVALLVSGISDKEKRKIKEDIKKGLYQIVIGTHAIIQDDVEFQNLGLVVIDEQHRFGVLQRNKLRKKGANVDFLLMSATPIPRTMAITIYGDMDISTLKTFPNGERKITTRLEDDSNLINVLHQVDKLLEAGSKMYVVCPLISDDEKSVEEVYKKLVSYYQDKYEVLLLHGKMSSEDKESIIDKFNKDKNTKVLVATTVIEVGIDIKEADIMLILGAERFGLAQIHQLRGRIGRNGKEGLCILFTSSKEEVDRLEFMCNCDDGFEISAYDLKRRGPGDIVGSKQSGFADLKFSNLVADYRILEIAREDGKAILKNKDNLENLKIIEYVKKMTEKGNLSID